MSMERSSVGVPEFDLADRMRKALRTSGVSVQEMADYLGVARNTVSTWINGRIVPNRQTVRLWSMRTGVQFDWLESGDSHSPQPGDGVTAPSNITNDTLSDDNSILLRVGSQSSSGAMRTTRIAA